ncbi:autotransporter assembly complex protein TamA [Luteimonas sp. BDR2-5]|uniref:autotransporter assembly complex protein TamA n=1 Tax=Proluteimonas luteida TaxID=2878685 RepID=UPI001E5004EA|nr:autotransporter assembly complex family protein [Luteimonas sp. BDR2-5]MCD9029120.1 autotransporter assembly complex protein TamA [Luteimonas sp. BDR2-5]
MRRFPLTLTAVAVLFSASAAVQAARVERVDVEGLDEAMTENVEVSLAIAEAVGKDVSTRRLTYLLRQAESDTRKALEPFGYYSPEIDVQRTREDGNVHVRIVVDPGQPVRVRNSDIAIIGAGGRDQYLARDLASFIPSEGAVFYHPDYDGSRNRISRRLAERGYFDAEFASRRVEVTRAEHAADIDLVWTSGDRYNMGPTTFEQTPEKIIDDSLLEGLVYWDEGSYYHQGRLDRLRTSLTRLDYFGNIDIEPLVEEANEDREVPVKVTLTPAKRSIYTAGVSYGTDSGAGIRLGVERRYVNMRGHKALAQLDYAQKRKTLTLQYRIPAFAWLDGWYTASLQASDEQTDYIDSRRIEFVASRSGQYNQFLNLVASMHVLRERWAYEADQSDPDAGPLYRYATFAYPSLRAEYIDVDDRLFPRAGIGGSVTLRGGIEGAGSDATFSQIHARASWFRGIGEANRLIVRGELGHTFTDALVAMPPSLRFYAGGDRSIRGYDWREVGPRLPASEGRKAYALGAKNVVTASVEFERYFTRSIGAAVFVDGGDAFDGGSPEWRTGVGVGVRYITPVGPLKLDIARGLDNPDSPFTIGLSIGAEF